MGVIAEWNGHQFVVEPTKIQSFKELSITGGIETKKSTTSGSDQSVSKKNGNARKVTLCAILNRSTGCEDVQAEAMNFVQEATDGAEDYMYCGGEKLLACKLMLTSAKVSQIEMTGSGYWTYAEVELTLEQSTKMDGAAAKTTGGGGGGKTTTKKGRLGKIDIAQLITKKAVVLSIAGTAGTKGTTATRSNNTQKVVSGNPNMMTKE